MAQILITKPGTLTKADKTKLRAVDVVVVEADDPAAVKLITVEGQELGGNDMLFAALSAIAGASNSSSVAYNFAGLLRKLMSEHRAEAKRAESQP